MAARRRLFVTGVCLALAGVVLVGCGGGWHRKAARTGPVVATATGGTTTVAPVVTPTVAARPDSGPSSVATASAQKVDGITSSPAATTEPPVVVPAGTLVATVGPGGAPGSRGPGAAPDLHVPGSWLGAATVVPVVGQQPGWVQVRLAQRPNGSTAWVPAADVSLATDPYDIVVDLGATRLRLFDAGQEVATFPAGSACRPRPPRRASSSSRCLPERRRPPMATS
jgi:hypothetical protein